MQYYKNQVEEYSKQLIDSSSNNEALETSRENLELRKKLEYTEMELLKLKNYGSESPRNY